MLAPTLLLRRARPAALFLALLAGLPAAHTQTAAPATPAAAATTADVTATQEQLLKLLRTSPTLTTVVARDPSLLSSQEYVARNNPELAAFLLAHPEVARNPSFYLFTNLNEGHGGPPEDLLERKIWPNLNYHEDASPLQGFLGDLAPMLVFVGVLATLIWLIRILLENRRWGRIFGLQTEVHNKLIEKFANNQDLLAYMDTEAGKRFLEAAPIPVNFEADQRMPNTVSRVLISLQIGIVLSLLGVGLIVLRSSLTRDAESLLVLGVVALMPGLGFIISAVITWILAGRFGLMPQHPAASATPHFDLRERP